MLKQKQTLRSKKGKLQHAVHDGLKSVVKPQQKRGKQGEDANDYLRNMVKNNEGFADRDEKTLPLKNFYALVPAVSLA